MASRLYTINPLLWAPRTVCYTKEKKIRKLPLTIASNEVTKIDVTKAIQLLNLYLSMNPAWCTCVLLKYIWCVGRVDRESLNALNWCANQNMLCICLQNDFCLSISLSNPCSPKYLQTKMNRCVCRTSMYCNIYWLSFSFQWNSLNKFHQDVGKWAVKMEFHLKQIWESNTNICWHKVQRFELCVSVCVCVFDAVMWNGKCLNNCL